MKNRSRPPLSAERTLPRSYWLTPSTCRQAFCMRTYGGWTPRPSVPKVEISPSDESAEGSRINGHLTLLVAT